MKRIIFLTTALIIVTAILTGCAAQYDRSDFESEALSLENLSTNDAQVDQSEAQSLEDLSTAGDAQTDQPDDSVIDEPPYDALLNLEIMIGKFRFQRIATTPCIVYSDTAITDMKNGTVYENRFDILMAVFKAMDGKSAGSDASECDFSHYIYMFDNEDDTIPWHYRFAICDSGTVLITNNDEFLCTIEISKEEIQSILDSLK